MKPTSTPRLCVRLAETFLLLAGLLVSPLLPAQVSLVKDIYPSGDSYPQNLTAVGNTLYFTANDGTHGNELYKSDGTAAGTVLVKDINPSSDSYPGNLTAVGNTLYFVADDGTNGRELWRSDGTAAGTVLVKDIQDGPNGSSPSNLRVFGNTLYFQADDGIKGAELWKSDGTAAGTVLVKDINPDSDGSNVGGLTVFNNTLYFGAYDVANGYELWRSDGTAEGTVLVKDIQDGPNGSFPSRLTAVGNTLYFQADDGTNGAELYKSDGTAAGTVLVKDIDPSGDSYPSGLTAVGNTLYFQANDNVNGYELWKSDGTVAGTVLVKNINPTGGSFPQYPAVLGNTLYFNASDGTNGRELWKTDGTAAGTVLVKDLFTGSFDSGPDDLTAVGNTLYFTASDGPNGRELWKTDGTAAGTVLVKDIQDGPNGSFPGRLTVVGSTLYFAAYDDAYGVELWKTDATPCDGRVSALPTTPAKVCQNDPLPVTFSLVVSCSFPPSDAFTVQLSNATGSFSNPTTLGYALPGTTNLALPEGLTVGTGYRVRILGGGQTSAASLPFQVVGPGLAVTPTVGSAPVCRGNAVTLSFNVPANGCPFPQGNVFTAQLTSSSGSFNNATNLGPVLAGQPNSVTIPVGMAAGSGYRIRIVSSSPALTSSISSAFQVKTCPTRLSAEEPALTVSPNPVVGGEIRVRVTGMENPQFTLTTVTGRGVGVSEKTDGSGEWVLTPKQRLAPGVYLLQASGRRSAEGQTQLTQRVLVLE